VNAQQAGPAYRRSSGVTWRDTGTSVVALARTDLGRRVYVLRGRGAEIWRLLDGPAPLAELAARLDPASGPDLDTTVDRLLDAGLLVPDAPG